MPLYSGFSPFFFVANITKKFNAFTSVFYGRFSKKISVISHCTSQLICLTLLEQFGPIQNLCWHCCQLGLHRQLMPSRKTWKLGFRNNSPLFLWSAVQCRELYRNEQHFPAIFSPNLIYKIEYKIFTDKRCRSFIFTRFI